MNDRFRIDDAGSIFRVPEPEDDITVTVHMSRDKASRHMLAVSYAAQLARDDTPFVVVALAEPGRDPDDNDYWDSPDDAWAITYDPTTNPERPVRLEIAGDGSLTPDQLGHLIGAATAAWTTTQKATNE